MNNPNILWAQDRNTLFLTIEIKEMLKENIQILNKEIIINMNNSNNINETNENVYKLELYGEICSEASNIIIKDTNIKLNLKKNLSSFWKRLSKTKQNNINIDWQKWVNESDSDSDDDDEDEFFRDFTNFKKDLPSDILEKDFSEFNEDFLPNIDDDGFDANDERSLTEEDNRNNSVMNIGKVDNLQIDELDLDKLDNDLGF